MIHFSTLWLYPSPSDCRYRPVEPGDRRLLPVPDEDMGRVTQMYAEISKEDLTRYRVDGRPCRVQVTHAVSGTCYILRAMSDNLPPLVDLGLATPIIREIMAPGLTGLVLIAGPQGSGKTTLAAAMVRERIKQYGGAAQVIEDPPELDLDGVHGAGVIQQIDVRSVTDVPDNDRVAWLAADALRSDTDIIFLGEVRRPGEAETVVSQAAVGALVVTTIHALGVDTAVERLISLAGGHMDNEAESMTASALAIVLHLDLSTQPVRGGESVKVLRVQPLIIRGQQEHGIRSAIRSKRYPELRSASQLQATQMTTGRYPQADR